jgi:hypothetical protein
MDPMSAITIRTLAQALLNLRSAELERVPTETLQRMLRILTQAAERVSDDLDRRSGL